MAYCYDNLKLEKGMYNQTGKSFTQVLEELDPGPHYKGTPLEGLDAYQRQLKRFDIKVKGEGSDVVEKFFRTSDSAVLFPEYIARSVRLGMEEADILPDLVAAVTRFDGLDYRSIASAPGDEKKLRRVEEGAAIPSTTVKTQENLVKLHKRGRMLVASYEAIRYQKLDLFSVTLKQIGAYISRMLVEDAIGVLIGGDGNDNAADTYQAVSYTHLDVYKRQVQRRRHPGHHAGRGPAGRGGPHAPLLCGTDLRPMLRGGQPAVVLLQPGAPRTLVLPGVDPEGRGKAGPLSPLYHGGQPGAIGRDATAV